jgi:exoribonuclease II
MTETMAGDASAPGDPPVNCCARVVLSDGASSMVRCERLSGYDVELIAEDAERIASGGALEVTIHGVCTAATVARLRQRLDRLRGRGIDVRIRRSTVMERDSAPR